MEANPWHVEVGPFNKHLVDSQSEEQRQPVFLSVAIRAMHRKSNGQSQNQWFFQ